MRIAVIGAGLAGLSAAARLVGAGHDVRVYERASSPGGRAARVESDGFRLDLGPTVLTLPDLVADTFAAAGRDIDDYLTLDRVDPIFRAVFADGSVIHVRAGIDAMSEEIRRVVGADDAAAFVRFADWLSDLYRATFNPFIDTNYDSVRDVLRSSRALWRLARVGGLKRLDKQVQGFFDDDRLRRLFSFQSLNAGVAPHDALALLGIFTYMTSVRGVYVPRGGVHELPVALATALADAGVDFTYNAEVTRILRSGIGAVSGVELHGETRVSADAVVCNADLPAAYRTMLGGVGQPRVVRRGEYSPSCMLWVAGVRGAAPDAAARHNVHFGAPWKKGFTEIIDEGIRMSDPSMLITVQSHDDPTVAPAGDSVISALEPVPNLSGAIDWAESGPLHLDEMRRRVGDLGYPTDAVVERTFDPLDWSRLGFERGTPFSLAHTLRQSGPLRPRNTDDRVPGLVFAGSATVPGVGVPMVLLSGKLAAERIDEYVRSTSVVRW